MKRFIIYGLVISTLLGTAPVFGQTRKPSIDVGVETVGVLQDLTQKNQSNTLPEVPAGFQSAVGNIFVNSRITSGIDVYFEMYLSSKHHEGYVMDREGYVYLSKLPDNLNVLGLNSLFRYIDLKAGAFEIDYGNWHLIRSDNGQVQGNPLIGNYIVDANTTEPGVEVIAHSGSLEGVLGVSTGTTTGDFKADRGTAVHGKIRYHVQDRIDVAASVYRVNHSGNPTGYPQNGSYSALYAGNRSGSRYSGVLGGGPEVGQIAPGKGQDVFAWQVDGSYTMKPLRLYGMVGVANDADANGSAAGTPADNWNYFGGEAEWYFTPKAYLGARYSQASAQKINGVDSNAESNRIQLGGGYWLLDSILLKLEYVNQHYNNFMDNQQFSGVLTEFSVKF